MLGPKCRICRREGTKLFLKGDRCYTTKCEIVKRKYPPGIHGQKGYPKMTGYGIQLREKQKIKRFYNISERQLKNYFNKAKKKTGNTEIDLIRMLETRLDSVVFNAGFGTSRYGVRQMINHGHVTVNKRKVSIPSFKVRVNNVIALKSNTKLTKKVQEALTGSVASKERRERCVPWLLIDETKPEIKVIKLPGAEDLPKDFNTKLVVEFYSR
ncbi:MAG: 30S ribosomal protein S4 [Patescibacteria group bacterium]|nr:30S ribosomal protein S4 [Patescibacteria group bacterium]MDD5121386.1 30S ribosomal protein S4 [Patescibacteria group bacterium]MDD5221793.1 30S ribosomal protein S4 [Patescibacteria group bacterium]MDD5395695.1 30S ribosomal protein S4 [Patescibacteria group bacterium]